MAHTQKTEIGHRNVVVQRGAGHSTTVWLEVELHPEANVGTTCLGLTGEEARTLGMSLIEKGTEAISIALDRADEMAGAH